MAAEAELGRVRIEPAGARELDRVMEVMNSAFDPRFGEAWTKSQCAGILPMSGVKLVLAKSEPDDRPVGFALYRTILDEAELLLLAVDPASRGKGVGARLLQHFIDHASQMGASRIHLEVREGNTAVNMYVGTGFEQIGSRTRYYRGSDGTQFDALTLERRL